MMDAGQYDAVLVPDAAAASRSAMTSPATTAADDIHALATAGRYGEALARANRELAAAPDDAELLFARAAVLFDWGRVREAREAFLAAEARGLARTALYLNLAWASHLMRRAQDAEHYARKALASDPSSAAAQIGLATVLQRMKRYPEAIAAYEHALANNPESGNCAAGIAYCMLEQKEYEGAEEWLRRAIALTPQSPSLWVNLGVALASRERYDEAFAALRSAEAMEMEQGLPPESAIDHAYTMILTGQDPAVVELLRRHLPHLPDPRAHSHYAFALLSLGRYAEGWDQYEVRWLQEPHLSHRPGFAQPVWAGQPLAGKTVLVRAEQGAGDIVQFARYATLLKARGARVVLQVRSELVRMAAGFADVDHAYAPPTPVPPFDYYVHVMGLPRAFGTEVATIPRDVPYLRIDPAARAPWQRRFERSDGLRVGLAWAGNPLHPRDRYRSIALAELVPLFHIPGVDFCSLQKQPKEGELEVLPPGARFTHLGDELADFEATAAAIEQMDLVICVDTAVAHIAGALGKPTWLLLPRVGDFRWLTGREDSPWYPTMRLFRQRVHGEWGEVVARVRDALAAAAVAGSVPAFVPAAPAPAPAPEPVAREGIARVTEARHGIVQYRSTPAVEDAARSIEWLGEYLEPQVDLLTRLLPVGAHVVEAGAGFGAQALPLARHAGASGHLWLYERDPVTQSLLRQNLERNQVAPQVTLMRRDLAGPASAEHADTVDALQVARLDLLKLGAGTDAQAIVEGAADTLWRLRPLVFAAVDDEAALARRLREFGYRTFRMRTALFQPGNFNARDEDVFAGRAALAVLAIAEEREVAVALDGCEEIGDGATGPARPPAGPDGESTLSRWVRKLLG